jgi:hypothetical protein
LAGRKLLLTDQSANLSKRRLVMLVKDDAISTGAGPESQDDPTIHGGSLRVSSGGGDGFDDTYELPAAGWKAVGRRGRVQGWKFRNGDPVRKVLLRGGGRIKIVAKGPALGHTLAAEPDYVDVVLTVGQRRYCLRFGGRSVFRDGKRYSAKKALAPASCSSFGSPGAAFVD